MGHGHIHISTGTIFLFVVLILGIVALMVWFFRPQKEPKIIYREPPHVPPPGTFQTGAHRPAYANPALGAGYSGTATQPGDPYVAMAAARPAGVPVYPPGHAYAGSPYYPFGHPLYDPFYPMNNGLVEGMLLGEMMAGNNRTEVIVERDGGGGGYTPEPTHSEPASAPDSGGIDIDYGSSNSSSDSSSSSDSGYSGGSDSGGYSDSGSSSSDSGGGVDVSW